MRIASMIPLPIAFDSCNTEYIREQVDLHWPHRAQKETEYCQSTCFKEEWHEHVDMLIATVVLNVRGN